MASKSKVSTGFLSSMKSKGIQRGGVNEGIAATTTYCPTPAPQMSKVSAPTAPPLKGSPPAKGKPPFGKTR